MSLSTADTALYGAGQYGWQRIVELAPQRLTTAYGTLYVEESLDNPVETRSENEQILAALNATMLGKASRDQLNVAVAGKSIGRMSMEDLARAIQLFESRVNREIDRERKRNGGRRLRGIIGAF